LAAAGDKRCFHYGAAAFPANKTKPDKAATREAAMFKTRAWLFSGLLLTAPVAAAGANVIGDWDEKAVGLVQTKMTPPHGYRVMAIMHLAMFEAVNSIDPRYKPYKAKLSASPDASKEAAATAAAAAVLSKLVPEAAADVQKTAQEFLGGLPDGDAKQNGVKFGEQAALAMLELRAKDGASVPDDYRPRAMPGVYVPTPITVGAQFPNVTPFAMTSPSQFRPKPPISLKSAQWAQDYNEIKELGEKNSSKRSARQTEDAKFWVLTGPLSTHPLERQIAAAKNMDVVDTARFLSLLTAAEEDALIAVLDAKYKYQFWRPITAIRNGDIDGNPATERVATWQPIDNTPMHPEYPCAHCIVSAAVVAVIRSVLGSDEIPEVTMTSPFAPGVTHRFANLRAYADEVANARIYAGFHYRFSTVVGRDMGEKIGAYVASTILRPNKLASAR
jgi:hypothetical protein